MPVMVAALEPSIVRIPGPDNTTPVGTGCGVTDRHVVTCAHVVVEALDLVAMAPDALGAEVPVDFTFSEKPYKTNGTAQVWWPAADPESPPHGGKAEVAVLRPGDELPPGVAPAILMDTDAIWHQNFAAFGFPVGHGLGVGATGRPWAGAWMTGPRSSP